MQVAVYSQENKKIGETEIAEEIFSTKWNPDLIHQALDVQLANRRQVLAHTKGRGEVRGGGRKPWRQKGTGRSRHGSIRSPLWRHGGVTFGPTKERNFSRKINKTMKRLAIFGILARKLQENQIKIVDDLTLKNPKTKEVAALLKNFRTEAKSVLIIPAPQNKNIFPAGRNLPRVKVLSPASLNVYDLLKFQEIILEKAAIEIINKTYLK